MIFNLSPKFPKKLPAFTYTGSYTLAENTGSAWEIRFLTSGSLTFTHGLHQSVDLFCAGGGGGGSVYNGGGGGYTSTLRGATLQNGQTYSVTVGDGGPVRSAGGASAFAGLCSASGGAPGTDNHADGAVGGGAGGSGGGGCGWYDNFQKTAAYSLSALYGNAGCDGSSGGWGYWPDDETGTGHATVLGGPGQGTTTRAFGESGRELYSTGGSGSENNMYRTAGPANTGNGGGSGLSGGSGIVIVRSAR